MPKRLQKSDSLQQQIKKFFFPMLVMAALLPLSLMAVVYGFSDTLFPKAAEPNTLRIWFTPNAVITKVGQPVTFTVMAAFDKTTAIIPSVNVAFPAPLVSNLNPSTITYTQPLQGKAAIGTVKFTPSIAGKLTLDIPPSDVTVGGDNHPSVVVDGATITVVQ